jgi:hypothetical protein
MQQFCIERGFQSFYVHFCYGDYLLSSVVQLGALRYKPEGRGFDSRWCHWNFSLT